MTLTPIAPSPTSPRSDIGILVVSCDAYKDLWVPFFYCFFKYWPDCPYPLYLGSNESTYEDPRVSPILIGRDVDYSSNLLAMLGRFPHEWLILWIEDRVLSAPTRSERVQRLIGLAQRRGVAYLKLIANHPFALLSDASEEIGDISKGARYRVCVTVALWQKKMLQQLLHPGETAWDIERLGSERSNLRGEAFCCTSFLKRRDPPLCTEHLLIKGRLLRDAKGFLRREGLEVHLAGRAIQGLVSHLYARTYVALLNLYSRGRLFAQRRKLDRNRNHGNS